jgi:DNA-binding NtrC family response regulator
LNFEIPDEELLPDCAPLGNDPEGRHRRRERRDRQGLLILERLRRSHPDLPVVLTTAREEIPFEEEALRLNADEFTYTLEDEAFSADTLVASIRRVLSGAEAPPVTGRFFWGRSSGMRERRRRVFSLAPTPLPLLITGPTGTGKSLLARDVIHPASGRTGAFVTFDCATVPPDLLPAALFGSLRGSFTGAIADRAGVFEAARNGTLFLDEIENLSLEAQKTLLTALNDGTIRRLGSTSEISHSARIVAASNVDLKERVASGGFRADLWMRLNPTLAIDLPPLHSHREDLAALSDLSARRFFEAAGHRREILSRVRAAGASEPAGEFELSRDSAALSRSTAEVVFALPPRAWEAAEQYPWPGNIRQFEMFLADVLAHCLYGSRGPSLDRRGRAVFSIDGRLCADLLRQARAGPGGSSTWTIEKPRPGPVASVRKELEKCVYRMLFRDTGGDFRRMAEILTGKAGSSRAVRLRFNRLGLSAREER